MPNIAIVGDPRLGSFEPVVRLVRQSVGESSLRQSANMAELHGAGAGWTPDVIVVLQAWPDQYSDAEANELISRFPLARMICCFGPWCDSDGRSRSTWPLAVRVPSASFAARFEHELALVDTESRLQALPTAQAERCGQTPVRPLPLTASRTEIFEFDCDGKPAPLTAEVAAVVYSPDRRWRRMLIAALERRGARVVEDTRARAGVIFFDADPWNASRASQLAAVRQAHPDATLIACAGFPRADLEAALRDAGADVVRSKLESLNSLTDLAAG